MSDTPRSDELIERLGKTPFESLERMCVLDAIVRLCRQLERECNKSCTSTGASEDGGLQSPLAAKQGPGESGVRLPAPSPEAKPTREAIIAEMRAVRQRAIDAGMALKTLDEINAELPLDDMRDAVRYRYIRGSKAYQGAPSFFPYAVLMPDHTRNDYVTPLFGRELDEAVDRAIKTDLRWDSSPEATEAELAAQARLARGELSEQSKPGGEIDDGRTCSGVNGNDWTDESSRESK